MQEPTLPLLVIVDRDGTLIPELSGSEAIMLGPDDIFMSARIGCEIARRFRARITCATNQPDLSRGLVTSVELDLFHAMLRKELGIEQFFICPHLAVHGCYCRKPQPGLLLDIVAWAGVSPRHSVVIGDRHTDQEAAAAAHIDFIHADNWIRGLLSWVAAKAMGPLNERR